VWINGCISSRETCQYLPRPPWNRTHKWKKRAHLSTYLSPKGIITSPFLILCSHTFNPLSTLSYIIYGCLSLSVTDYHTVEACNTAANRPKCGQDPKKKKKKAVWSKQKPTECCCVWWTLRLNKVQLRDIGSSSSSPFPGTLETCAVSLWTDYGQLKLWQLLKLSPHAASDSSATDITLNASAWVIGIRRTGWDKRNAEE